MKSTLRSLRRGLALATTFLPLAAMPLAADEVPAHPEKPFLWKVEGPDLETESYLFGTIHLGMPPLDTLHPAAQRAFDAADAVYTELSMNPADQLGMAGVMMRADGRTLSQSIGEELLGQLNAELRLIMPELDATSFEPLKTWAVAMAVPMLPFQIQGGKALDHLLWERAAAAGKKTAGLEKVEDQVGIFDDLTEDEQKILLSETLRQMREDRDAGRDPMKELVDAYVKGDPEEMRELLERMFREMEEGEHKELGERIMKRMLEDRDEAMAATIHDFVVAAPEQSHFFAAGAAHFVGPTSIRHHLEEKGYTVTLVTE